MGNDINEAKNIFHKFMDKKIRSIEEITTGLSNLNYKVNDSYVLRMPSSYRDPTLQYKQEFEVYEAIKDLEISEKVVQFLITSGIKISRYVHNARPYVKYPTKIQITQVAKVLKKLHSSKLKVSFSYEYINKLNSYKEELPAYFLLDENVEKTIVDAYLERLSKDPQVLCHNDVVQNNMLFRYNDVVLIDWEYASMNSPYFDLASFISENNLNSDDELFFLSKYFGSSYTKRKQTIVQAYIAALDVLFYYWAQKMFIKKGDSIYLSIAAEKLGRIKLDKSNVK